MTTGCAGANPAQRQSRMLIRDIAVQLTANEGFRCAAVTMSGMVRNRNAYGERGRPGGPPYRNAYGERGRPGGLPYLIFLAATLSVAAWGQGARYDILITGARVIDGSGTPWFYADVGIQGDIIAAIGHLDGAQAGARIDGRGLVVAPGFIDIHSHGRRGIGQVPTAENYLREGVTTIIEGPDGSSPLPIKTFLDGVAKSPISINFATFVGQGSIRQQVIGSVNRKATPEELSTMKGIAEQAMHDGAFGLSTGLFYVPGNFTPTEEVIELAKVVGKLGGIHISHMREEASHVLDSVKETIRIGEEGGLPTQITHHKTIGQARWGKSVESLKLV